jgi:hypothetical protein
MQHNKRNFSYYQEIEFHSKSWFPVNRNGWWIKFSTTFDTNILLVFTSKYTGQTLIRFFAEENDAVKFINYLIEQDSKKEYLDE